jgi:two-component SAPR family response regulator
MYNLSLEILNNRLATRGDLITGLRDNLPKAVLIEYDRLQSKLGMLWKDYLDMEATDCSLNKKDELRRIYMKTLFKFTQELVNFETVTNNLI